MSEVSFHTVSIHGVPRSGTSWLGQIFDSHPDVAYRHQPLFAYRFKDRLNLKSSPEDVSRFLHELYEVSDDEFILDVKRRESAAAFWQRAVKENRPRYLVMKMVRYHHLLQLFLENITDARVIGIVRHPCAVINSWLQAPKEFRAGWSAQEEWRYAPKKNAGRIEEFNGFEKWKELASLFLALEEANPQRFYLVRYEDLVANAAQITRDLFDFVGLDTPDQALRFLQISQSRHCEDPYSVLKHPRVKDRWRAQLDPTIVDEIMHDIERTALARFLA